MAYALLPNFLVIRKGPMRHACNLWNFLKENVLVLDEQVRTISPLLNYLSLHLALGEVIYDLVLIDRCRLTLTWTFFIYSEKSRPDALGLGGNGNDNNRRCKGI